MCTIMQAFPAQHYFATFVHPRLSAQVRDNATPAHRHVSIGDPPGHIQITQ
jgi:hypothetical protein